MEPDGEMEARKGKLGGGGGEGRDVCVSVENRGVWFSVFGH